MDLYSISATSLEVAELCMARFAAEKIDRVPRTGDNGPADSGSVLHSVLEIYVPNVYKHKTHEPTLKYLLELFDQEFPKWFGSLDKKNQWYIDGLDQLKKWHKRTDLTGVEIISTEVKDFIEVKTIQGTKKYNYIWDRCDKITDKDGNITIRVVDYKSWRKNLTTEDMEFKIQVRMYAMAAFTQFKHLNPSRIVVQLDQLRWGTVGLSFTREEALATWEWMKKLVRKIMEMDRADAKPTLNPECGFCPIKLTCPELRRNIMGGGAFSLDTPEKLAQAKYELESQSKGVKYALDELNDIISAYSRKEDILQWDAGEYEVVFKPGRGQRTVNAREIADIVGADIFKTIGTVNLKSIDELLKSDELTDEQKKEIKDSMGFQGGALKAQVTKKGGLKQEVKANPTVKLESLEI